MNRGAYVSFASKTQLCATASFGSSPIFLSRTVTRCPGFTSKLVTLNFMKSSPVISTIFGGATLREHPSSAEANASRMMAVAFTEIIMAAWSAARQCSMLIDQATTASGGCVQRHCFIAAASGVAETGLERHALAPLA